MGPVLCAMLNRKLQVLSKKGATAEFSLLIAQRSVMLRGIPLEVGRVNVSGRSAPDADGDVTARKASMLRSKRVCPSVSTAVCRADGILGRPIRAL